jgi:hypothetical protein
MSRSSHRSLTIVRHPFARLALTALAAASVVACDGTSGTNPSPSNTAPETSGTVLDPCTVPDANARPGPAAGPAIVDGGRRPPDGAAATPPGTGGVSDACRQSGGAVEGGGAGNSGAEQQPSTGGLGDTGSGGSSRGPSESPSGGGPVSSLESDRPPAGY